MGEGQAWPAGVVACFDGDKPGRFYREAYSSVEVLDEGSTARQVVPIEGGGCSGPLGGNGRIVFWAEGAAPNSGSAFSTPAGDED